MPEIGKNHSLIIQRETSAGLFLADEDGGEVLLPFKYAPKGFKPGDQIEVFVYLDSEGRPIATTRLSLLEVGQIGVLEAHSVTRFGAFMDIGTDKDLFVPYKEQKAKVDVGKRYVVYMYIDEESGRLTGSCLVHKFLEPAPEAISIGAKVNLIVYERTDLGYNVIVDQQYRGLIYFNEIFQSLKIGDQLSGFIRKRREDGRLDIRLFQEGVALIQDSSAQLWEVLRSHDGFLPLTDHTDPEIIRHVLGMSKKAFKKALGGLYKNKQVRIEEDGIYAIFESK
jgi:predicted RNA-binding protein (virulence factor B family)